jgi:hypothetical protein
LLVKDEDRAITLKELWYLEKEKKIEALKGVYSSIKD